MCTRNHDRCELLWGWVIHLGWIEGWISVVGMGKPQWMSDWEELMKWIKHDSDAGVFHGEQWETFREETWPFLRSHTHIKRHKETCSFLPAQEEDIIPKIVNIRMFTKCIDSRQSLSVTMLVYCACLHTTFISRYPSHTIWAGHKTQIHSKLKSGLMS